MNASSASNQGDRDAIAVVGSLNVDLVVRVAELPVPGETVLGGDYTQFFGGKGANQAVAAARAGAHVRMLGAVGDDAFAPQLRAALQTEGIAVDTVDMLPGSSGLALIAVSDRGHNQIVVSAGANGRYTPDRIDIAAVQSSAMLLAQLEIPLETVQAAIASAVAADIPVLLNPAPARPLADAMLADVDYLVVNEVEAAVVAGMAPARELATHPDVALDVARRLRDRGASTVILTLGGAGMVWVSDRASGYEPAFSVNVVDTTAAGDGCCGALAAQLVRGVPVQEAVHFANAAGAIAVTRAGAQASLGNLAEIEHLLQNQLQTRA